MKVKLDDVILSLEMVNSETNYYYNPETEEIFDSNIGQFKNLSEDELDDLFTSFIILPTRYEIDEYSMMEDFIETTTDGTIYNDLMYAISGRGAFRRFKDTCFDYGIFDNWYKYREKKYEEIAINWCRENNIEFR